MKRFLDQLTNFSDFRKNQNIFDICFYVESSSYFVYFEKIIQHLVQNYKCKICYLTSSFDDPLLSKNNYLINAYYIGQGLIRTILFSTLDVKIMVLTMPDLNMYHIRRSHNQVHYIFIPHNMCSTHMVFRKGAFDHYDTFFCVGPHHVKELTEAQERYKTKSKRLVKIGYPRLDDIYNSVSPNKNMDKINSLAIMIAPSWFLPGILDTIGSKLISLLLNQKHQTVLSLSLRYF